MYFTRERHRGNRVYFGPYSNAKRVRSTLEVLAKVFMFRSCTGPEPGRRSGSPCLDYYIKRCEAPCVGYVTKERYRESIDGVIDFLSGRFATIERDLEERMLAAAAAEEFEQATLERNRLQAVRSLLERRRVAGDSTGTFDAVAVAVDGRDANAQVFQVRDGVLSDRQSFYLENATERELGRGRGGVHAPVLRRRGLAAGAAGRPARARRPHGAAPRRSPAAATGRSSCAPPSAARSAGSSSSPSATRASRSTRSVCARSAAARGAWRRSRGCSTRSGSTRRRSGSSASTSPTSAARTRSPRWSCSRAARRRSPTTGASRSVTAEGSSDDYAAMAEVLSRRFAQWERQLDISPHDASYDASFAALPNLVVIDGGKGQLAAGLAPLRGFRERGVTVVSLAKRIEEIFLPGPRGAARARPLDAGAAAAAARPRRGAPLRDHPPSHAAATRR